MRRLMAVIVVLLLPALAQAVIETYEFSDPALEARYRTLSAELRCPKCQNQNIADSNAPISQDLRRLLYEQLEAGATDAEIRNYMVDRYGEFVRYRPSFSGATVILWLAPAILLLGGVLVAIAAVRGRRARNGDSESLSAEEQARLAQLVQRAERDQ